MPYKKTLSPEDILCAIFVEMDRRRPGTRGGKCAFLAHEHVLQREFAKLRKYRILRCFVFGDSGPERYSQALADALTNLGTSGFLNRFVSGNPEPFIVREAAWEYYAKELLPLPPKTGRQIKKISEELLKEIPALPRDAF